MTSLYSGGDGLTPENPIVINADHNMIGVASEYQYITNMHGAPKVGWTLKLQRLLKTENGLMDHMKIVLADNKEVDYYFDITQFYGKWLKPTG